MKSNKEDKIVVTGARVHNLKNVDVAIPRYSLVVITGLSGSGKSSLAFDTIYAEGQRRYMETLSTYARQFVGSMERPDVDKITGPPIKIPARQSALLPKLTTFCVCCMPEHPEPTRRLQARRWCTTPTSRYAI